MSDEQARTTATVVAREWGRTVERLAALDDDGWRTPTRCEGWAVEDLVRHAVWGVSMEADALRRLRAGEPGPADGVEVPGSPSPGDLLDALRRSLADLLGELDALGPADAARLVPMPYGDVPLPLVLDIFVMEAAVHADDLAHALGHGRGLHADVVGPTTSVLAVFLPVFAANGSPPADGASLALVGDRVRLRGEWRDGALTASRDDPTTATTTVSGRDSALLLYALGRVGLADSGLQVSGDESLARDLKRHVPGP